MQPTKYNWLVSEDDTEVRNHDDVAHAESDDEKVNDGQSAKVHKDRVVEHRGLAKDDKTKYITEISDYCLKKKEHS